MRQGSNQKLCFQEDEGALDYSTVTKWLKKFYSSSKNLDNQTRSGWPKTGFQAIVAL